MPRCTKIIVGYSCDRAIVSDGRVLPEHDVDTISDVVPEQNRQQEGIIEWLYA